MKKMFAVGATAALMLAATSPAFAQATSVRFSDDDLVFFNQVQNVSGNTVTQSGDANASSIEGDATAETSAELGVDQRQVLNGFFGF